MSFVYRLELRFQASDASGHGPGVWIRQFLVDLSLSVYIF